jgi:ATP-dependent RNA helicase DDX49/DBP8
MRMVDEGHEDKVQDRRDQKKRDQARKRKHEE